MIFLKKCHEHFLKVWTRFKCHDFFWNFTNTFLDFMNIFQRMWWNNFRHVNIFWEHFLKLRGIFYWRELATKFSSDEISNIFYPIGNQRNRFKLIPMQLCFIAAKRHIITTLCQFNFCIGQPFWRYQNAGSTTASIESTTHLMILWPSYMFYIYLKIWQLVDLTSGQRIIWQLLWVHNFGKILTFEPDIISARL